MRKFKNFIYRTNDILIAIVVILVACGLIAWRLNVIMDYPATLTSEVTSAQSQDADADKAEKAGDSDKAEKAGKAGKSDAEGVDKSDADGGNASNNGADGLYAGGNLSKSVTVTVQGGSATAAANCLVAAGLFSDYNDYAQACKKAGNSPEAIKASTFTFSKGMSKVDIAKMVTQ